MVRCSNSGAIKPHEIFTTNLMRRKFTFINFTYIDKLVFAFFNCLELNSSRGWIDLRRYFIDYLVRLNRDGDPS